MIMSISEKLIPCMRCGSDKIEVVYSNTAFCRCKKCGLTGKSFPTDNHIVDYIDRKIAIDWWNKKVEKDDNNT
jgi:uncharacterized Zn finger protein